ncbi:TPT-domain-containing protein [Epithele typhae]|uniref:TPT-domain-containing protein n=1 Tax=Epithele typhae TaxID=378194 RepID=UPI0020082C9D|nr:TPT-domain-containing protein [Epithele typhae]KAH9929031.1 TPT-domain-containing protein [Epithele typhae]
MQTQRVDPSDAGDLSWNRFASAQHSPRHRSVFPRDIANTPAFVLPSPLLPESGVASPSLPFVAPQAPATIKRPLATRRGKKTATRRRIANPQLFWLAAYFAFNLGLTLYNKGVLVRFPFPYTLTAIHALFGAIGGAIFKRRRLYTPARLDVKAHAVLVAFSVLFSVNIAVSNISLHMVTIPFHQVVRAATPVFTILLSTCIRGTPFNGSKLITLIPVMLGVALATYGDYSATTTGFLLTLLGTLLAALKAIFTNILQTSFSRASLPKLHPLDLLSRMSPLALVQCLACAYLSGELARIRALAITHGAAWFTHALLVLAGNGALALGLNVVSFTANGRVGALSMAVAANVKQVLTVLLATAVFDVRVSGVNALGISLALAGGAWYAWVEYSEKEQDRTKKAEAAEMHARMRWVQ